MNTTLKNNFIRLIAAALALGGLSLSASPAGAATVIPVTAGWESDPADGLCSLREAIIAANTDAVVDACPAGSGADTILLPAGWYDLTITGAGEDAALTGDLDITGDLTLIGNGSAVTTINGNGDRILHLIGPVVVTITGVTVRGGFSAENGAGILNEAGTLTLTDSLVTGNTTTAGSGGGLAAYQYATVTLIGSSVDGNTAAYGHGGGIFNEGTLTVTNGSADGNFAEYSGGALSNTGSATFIDSTLNGNSAENGGAIYNLPLVGIGSPAAVILTNSTVSENSAVGSGGGIHNLGTLTLTNSALSENTAGGDGGGLHNQAAATFIQSIVNANSSGANGGGIYNAAGGELGNAATANLVNSTVSGNDALNGGGVYDLGIVTLRNVTVAFNSAGSAGAGGGVYVDPVGTLRLANSLIGRNTNANPVVSKPDCSGQLLSLGYNLIQNVAGCAVAGAGGNLFGVLPRIGTLQNNGGPTLTHALLVNSPAIDAGNPAGCKDTNGSLLTTDQRGFLRPKDGNGDKLKICDIGAFEY